MRRERQPGRLPRVARRVLDLRVDEIDEAMLAVKSATMPGVEQQTAMAELGERIADLYAVGSEFGLSMDETAAYCRKRAQHVASF